MICKYFTRQQNSKLGPDFKPSLCEMSRMSCDYSSLFDTPSIQIYNCEYHKFSISATWDTLAVQKHVQGTLAHLNTVSHKVPQSINSIITAIWKTVVTGR